jgi:D-alanine-D-alanine ligase
MDTLADMLQLALIFGGRSAEHDVSLQSARFVAAVLESNGHEVIPVGVMREGQWKLPFDLERAIDGGLDQAPGLAVRLVLDPDAPGLQREDGVFQPLDFAFPIMHGTFAEDGTLQGLLELAGVPYAGAGVAASAVGMDKELMKAVFAAHGLPQAEYLVFRGAAATGETAITAVEAQLAYPVFVKPANLGSSIGITKAHSRGELVSALEFAASFDRKTIVERAVVGRELECAVLGNDEPHASVAGEVVPANEYYDYEAKYSDGMMSFVIPAAVAHRTQAEVAALAVAAYAAVDCCGYARCDFFVEEPGGRVLVNEINTIPGMTPTSGFPRLWAASGIDNRRLIEDIVELGLERHAVREALRTAR